jgi:CobQ-like glutamine amidotransferase family enzyme
MYTYEWVTNPEKLRPFANDLRALIYLITREAVIEADPFNEFPVAMACQKSHVLSAFYRDGSGDRLAGIAVLTDQHQLARHVGFIPNLVVRKEHSSALDGLVQRVITKAKELRIQTLQVPDEERLRVLLCTRFKFDLGPQCFELNL